MRCPGKSRCQYNSFSVRFCTTDLDFGEAFESESAEGSDAEVGQLEVKGVVRVVGEEVLVLRNLFSRHDLVSVRRRGCGCMLVLSEGRAHDEVGSSFGPALIVFKVTLVEFQVGERLLAPALGNVAAVRLARRSWVIDMDDSTSTRFLSRGSF